MRPGALNYAHWLAARGVRAERVPRLPPSHAQQTRVWDMGTRRREQMDSEHWCDGRRRAARSARRRCGTLRSQALG